MTDKDSAEIANNRDAFNSFLKLPSAGYREYDDGSMTDKDTYGL